MADAAVSAAIQVALQAVVSLAADHVNLVREFPTERQKLHDSAAMIRGFLASADEEMHSPGVQKWLKQLEEEVFKADNVLDELNYENLRRKVKYQNQLTKKKVFFCFSFFNKIGFRSRLGSMIREINTNLQRIHQDAEGLGLAYKHQTDSKIVRSDVLGRDEDESKIVKKLLTESESDSISVISVTGMGGLGKTTLAKAVFNTPQFNVNGKRFDKKIWVCVAKPVNILELFKMILETSTGKKADVDNRQVIVQGIEAELKEKRYLLVLDDLWNNNQDGLLDDFFSTLAGLNAKKGSWCLVTTRLQEVAIVLSRHRQINFARHELGKLCNDDCWSIIKKWVNVGEEVPKDIKEQVLKRCDGLPLAAKLIGGLLFEKTKEEWLSILEESLLKGGIEQILKVSFDHLSPAPVKKCFAYCSIFDQDTELEQDRLVELWMAEGFLQPDPQNERMMEKIGCEYFRILLQTSLLEEVRDWRGTWYKMHDLVHDFAKSILNRNGNNQDRYLAVYSSERETINEKPSLRTLFLKGGIADEMLSKFKYLHVLKLFGADAKELPTSIGKLIHLHLLDISESSIRTLPESLCKLYSLQTLRIGMLVDGFPKKMSNLISMRHLHYHDYYIGRKIQMPSMIGRWTCLQTLRFFNIGRQEEGRGIQELGTLQDLKGSLEIRNLELVNGKDDAELANLSKKPNLHRLVFEWGDRDEESDNCDEDVLEGLQPHPNLKELQILKFMGDQFPQWFMNLTSLVDLHLVNCRELPPLGQLSSLQHLYLCGLENTTCIGLSFYSMTLKKLSLKSIKNLEEWKDAHEMRSTADVFPVLEKLSISNCPKLTTIPTPSHFPCLDVLEITENCHVLLVEKVLSNIANLSSLELSGGGRQRVEHIRSLKLVRRPESSLSIDGCDSLPAGMLERLCLFPTLEVLEIRGNCPLLLAEKVLSNIANLSSLKLSGGSRQRIESLKLVRRPESSLTIDGCDSLPAGMLERLCLFPTLQSVELNYADNITTLRGMSCAACLERLAVLYCKNLRELPEDLYQFQALKDLMIWACPRIDSIVDYSASEFDWAGLAFSSTLQHVSLYGMRDTESLPHQLQDLTTITSLNLEDFGAIEALPDWLGNLASLDKLILYDCPKLEYLPSVDAMERLKLRRLEIDGCPLLAQRCTPESGSEWPKISNISERKIY
ncbi:unnamed protein product [Coffea canephora]|uniref:DH200=94 genomic scaffold, scaffold_3295 n=1 Tax=Coffea canephora TaxID=49390 RepID=A0A068VL35_COFCA|nr:unnamed protein product [Coffea canephora]